MSGRPLGAPGEPAPEPNRSRADRIALAIVVAIALGIGWDLLGRPGFGGDEGEDAARLAGQAQLIRYGRGEIGKACEHVVPWPYRQPEGTPPGTPEALMTRGGGSALDLVMTSNSWEDRCFTRLASAMRFEAGTYVDVPTRRLIGVPKDLVPTALRDIDVSSRSPGRYLVKAETDRVTYHLQIVLVNGRWLQKGTLTVVTR